MDAEDEPLPIIDPERCTGCGHCVALCPPRAVELRAGKAVITRPAACTFCEICETYCPEEAIGRPFLIRFGAS
jgi:NAD-dependent dihydropyrimidine dehydrogenase PreA subunit